LRILVLEQLVGQLGLNQIWKETILGMDNISVQGTYCLFFFQTCRITAIESREHEHPASIHPEPTALLFVFQHGIGVGMGIDDGIVLYLCMYHDYRWKVFLFALKVLLGLGHTESLMLLGFISLS
jgi:hypothetical protein